MSLKQVIIHSGLQALTLAAFIGLVTVTSLENPFAEINTGTLLFWKLWWPLIPFIVLLFGRFWCSICPFSTISNILKRFFPYTVFKTDWFIRHGLLTSIAFYLLLVIANVAFSIESNASYTLMFICGMLGIMVLLNMLFGYKAYCYGACPVGLFLNLYKPITLNRLKNNTATCKQCSKQLWIPEKPLISTKSTTTLDNRDWRFRIECLKKCNNGSTVMKFGFPTLNWKNNANPTLLQVFAPGIVLMIFAVSLFERSNFFLHYYEQIAATYSVTLTTFQILSIPLIVFLISGANMMLLKIACRFFSIEPQIVLRKLGGLFLLLFLFHLSLVLQEFSELEVLSLQYPALNVLPLDFLSFETDLCIPCILTLTGIALAFLYGIASPATAINHPASWRSVSVSVLFLTLCLSQLAFFAILTLKILPYTAC